MVLCLMDPQQNKEPSTRIGRSEGVRQETPVKEDRHSWVTKYSLMTIIMCYLSLELIRGTRIPTFFDITTHDKDLEDKVFN
jgi:hypothetical protein